MTIILTTHYIEEAQEMADRIGVINKGEIILVEEKNELMRKLGKKQLTLHLPQALSRIPDGLNGYALSLSADGQELVCTYDAQDDGVDVPTLISQLTAAGVRFKDIQTTQSSLEDIFVSLVKDAT